MKEPIKITWKDLNYTVQVPDPDGPAKTKPFQVLKNLTGYALPGQTCYIMGASGAGKTSLMNALSDRIGLANGATLNGDILVNDSLKLDQKLFGSYATYVMQDDILFGYFTVKEALTFAARLKLTVDEAEQDRRVN